MREAETDVDSNSTAQDVLRHFVLPVSGDGMPMTRANKEHGWRRAKRRRKVISCFLGHGTPAKAALIYNPFLSLARERQVKVARIAEHTELGC